MINITKKLTIQPDPEHLQSLKSHFSDNLDNILFFDIETTGFSPRNSMCYLIGCVYYDNQAWSYTQWFAENESDEPFVLSSFFEFMKSFHVLIHFNGDGFDLPFLTSRCMKFDLKYNFSNIISTDLFKCARSLKKLINLDNYKQKTIETFLGIERADECSGGELIAVYHDYVKQPEQKKLELLLLHNHDDICGMLELVPILFYKDITTNNWTIKKTVKNVANDYEGNPISEVIFQVTLPHILPTPVSLSTEYFYLSASEQTLRIRVPVYCGEVKYFYSNYKDYYYLTNEDYAIHKSVASFVDKKFRKQAKASNCYAKKTGEFMMQSSELFSPVFKINYNDALSYFELTDQFFAENELLQSYLTDLLSWYFN